MRVSMQRLKSILLRAIDHRADDEAQRWPFELRLLDRAEAERLIRDRYFRWRLLC